MKTSKLITLTIALILSMGLAAQDDFETVIKPGSGKGHESGGFGALRIGYTQMDGRSAIMGGVRGAFIAGHRFSIGGGFFGFMNRVSNNFKSYEYFIGGGYGGLILEAILFPEKAFHVTFPILIGGGTIATMPYNYTGNGYDNYVYDYGSFFVFEPAVELEMNMVKFFRMALGVSYRLTSGLNIKYPYAEVPGTALNYFNFYLIFKFGKF